MAYDSQTGVAAWEKFVTDKADISFAIGVGSGVTLPPLQLIAFPNTNSDQYAQVVTNEAQLANTLLSTVQAGVAQGSTALIAGGTGDGLVLGADGGYVSRLVVDGVTYLYDPAAALQPNNSTLSSSLVERTFSTILGATLTFNFATGVYRYQVPPDSAISGRQEIFNVTGHDLDGDEKTVRLVIDVSYQAPLDGNRDQIITNIVDGSPITVSAGALLHNDAKSAATTVTGSGGAIDGTVSGSTSIVFDPDFAAGNAPTVAETAAANDTLATAIDLTARAGFGQIALADVGKVANPALPGMLFTGGLSSNADVDYIKVHLRAGERIVLDIDSTTGGLNSLVSLRDAADVQLAANDSDSTKYGGSGSSSGNDSYLQYTVQADGDYYIRVSSSGSATSGNYSLWIQVDPNTGFDYTISDGLTSDTAHADVLRVAGSTLTGTSGDEILIGGSGNEIINAGDGRDVLQGGVGNDTLNAEAGNDLLEGGSGSDTLSGGNGLDRLVGGADTDTLSGGAGADTFVWQLADRGAPGTPITDTVTDLDSVANSDKLDLRDLLQGEIANPAMQNLDGYLHFEKDGLNTIVHVSSTGGFSTGYSISAEDQTIVLQNVDLVGSLTTDQAIIQNLLNQGKLQTD